MFLFAELVVGTNTGVKCLFTELLSEHIKLIRDFDLHLKN